MQGLLEAIAISKRFGATVALDAVDFSARPGEIHALLGENGAGKTTLMNVIAGHLRPDRGAIRLDGAELKTGSAQAALHAGIATVHQSPMLFERLSVVENLALGGFGTTRLALREVAQQSAAMAARLGFTLRLDQQTLDAVSIAERMRLEILRALSFGPRVLILDEPTGLLAPAELSGFLDLLRALRGRGPYHDAARREGRRANHAIADLGRGIGRADGGRRAARRGARRYPRWTRRRGLAARRSWTGGRRQNGAGGDFAAAAGRRNPGRGGRGRQRSARADRDSGRRAPSQPRPSSDRGQTCGRRADAAHRCHSAKPRP